ncbi:hypothetical protein ACSTS3_06170 [Aquimarina muelleri]|uniref:hypothetical protein n=1 Tax=Aquimarina muelleri TaxID=279356 RepID=UPI003F689122
MKVTPKLIEKYLLKDCSEQEIKIVEQWIASNEQEQSTISNSNLEKMESEIWNSLYKNELQNTTKVIPLYKKAMRYAAVACVAGLIFFAGRFSTITNTTIDPQNNLLVYGGNGTHAKIPGNEFSLQFDGQLKLFNGSKAIKTVIAGNKTYTLEPMQTYFLMGNNQNSSLISSINFVEEESLAQLKGNFGIKILKA